ncbi:sigma 54-interacting transcriptional regulator [Akkermansia sp.]|uniref:sigma 54-interacting transcriptional regulator n=2 Tax=Akkermansia sp. TaxID=1872421 RepID=UPI003AAE0D07
MKMPVLLIVDDEKPTRDALRMGFQDDYEVYTAANLSQAVTLLREESPDLVLTDLRLGGESGTGKELVAQAIHSLSGRPENKFVAVNCAALSPQLLESELVGHEKGSFTGAGQRRIGRFEQADGGTIFLDEIGEIDAGTQVRLLRVLSERTIERVGSNTPIPVNVRIIAATNKSLKKLVQEGKFREDLYFRLNVVHIQMPPLRDRREDVPLLATAFLKEFARENNKEFKPLSRDALDAVRNYSWPGNVRELRTAMEHGVVMSNSASIELSHLPPRLHAPQQPAAPGSMAQEQLEDNAPSTQNGLVPAGVLNLSLLERNAIQQALARSNGNRTAAAHLLGISRRTLQRKLQDIQPS